MWEIDYDWAGFQWISSDDNANSTIAFRRIDKKGKEIIAVFNFTPNSFNDYKIGVPSDGTYKVILDTSLEKYGGTKPRLSGTYKAKHVKMHSLDYSIALKLNGLSAIYLEKVENKTAKKSKEKKNGTKK